MRGEKYISKSPELILGAQGKYKPGFRFFYLAPSLGRKVLFLHEAKERTEVGFKFFPNAKARNLTTQRFLALLL